MTAYAIVKHRLFDIRLIVARAVSYSILIAAIAILYSVVLFVGATYIFKTTVDSRILWAGIVFTTIIALSFQLLRAVATKLTDRIFFKGRYSSEKLLSNLTHIMAETIEINELTGKILKTLTEKMRITKAAFLMIDKHKITSTQSFGYEDHKFAYLELEALFHQYVAAYHYFIFEDLTDKSIKKIFRKLDISAAIPIRVEDSEVAILILGPKLSGEMYNKQDINLLDVFAPEAGIAIQNAKAYEKIKRFNKELEARVEERTHQLKESTEREIAKAKDITRLKDEFVFVATHELKAPVTAIRGFLELTEGATKDFPKDVRQNQSQPSFLFNT